MDPRFSTYIGIPYVTHGRDREGLDCWGLVKLVLFDLYGVQLPDYGDRYRDGEDWQAISQTVRDGLQDGWERVLDARAGDLLILNIAGRPWHCGLIVGPDLFTHASPGASVVIERLDNPRWARRVEGIYRCQALRSGQNVLTRPSEQGDGS